jgi:hypothetical protein
MIRLGDTTSRAPNRDRTRPLPSSDART